MGNKGKRVVHAMVKEIRTWRWLFGGNKKGHENIWQEAQMTLVEGSIGARRLRWFEPAPRRPEKYLGRKGYERQGQKKRKGKKRGHMYKQTLSSLNISGEVVMDGSLWRMRT